MSTNNFPPPADENAPKVSSKKITKKVKKNAVTLNQLVKYKEYLQALANTKSQRDLLVLMNEMKNDSFNILCSCMHDFLHDRGVMHNYFTDDEADRLKHMITPWSKKLKQFTNPKTKVIKRKQLLKTRHKGGSVILASVISALLPMAIHAISNWISPQKKK